MSKTSVNSEYVDGDEGYKGNDPIYTKLWLQLCFVIKLTDVHDTDSLQFSKSSSCTYNPLSS